MSQCKQCKKEFTIFPEDKKFYQRLDVPEPTFCPDCRLQRRLIWRNSSKLYQRECNLCGKNFIGLFSPDKKLTVYCNDCYWSDNWNDLKSGRDFDFNRTFNEQFAELIQSAPNIAVHNESPINSDYTNLGYRNRNCYLCFGTDLSEDCYYCTDAFKCRNTFDCYFSQELELCSWCIDCCKSYNTHYSQECENLQDCYGCFDCKNCHHCLGCAGLRNKGYYLFNKKVSPEEWQEQVDKIIHHQNYYEIYNRAKKNWQVIPKKATSIIKSENCTGNHIKNCKNIFDSFDCNEVENAKYCHHIIPTGKDIMDVYGSGAGCELTYEYIMGYGYNLQFSSICYKGCFNLQYCYFLAGCKDCFGCASLKKKQYCIFNKQYTKEEYFVLKEKIIEHMKKTGEFGEFLNIKCSPFCYNETEAQLFFPLAKKQALNLGYHWQEEKKLIIDKNLPVCLTCGKNFKIIKQEQAFLKKQNLPNPVDCPDCRFQYLFKMRNPYKLWQRKCDKCHTNIQTAYSPDKSDIIYCEECYQKEIY